MTTTTGPSISWRWCSCSGCCSSAIPRRYRLWRNTLALATGLALIGFSFFPVLPPRLLPPGYHFVDTLRVIGGLWSFSSGPVNDVSNQYAAMPSLHTTWSAWCAFAVLPLIRPLWGKVLVLLYPAATIFCIIVTANHYFADVIAGLLLLGFSYLLALVLTSGVDRWHARRAIAAASGQAAGRQRPVVNDRPGSGAPGSLATVVAPRSITGSTELLSPEIERWAAVDPRAPRIR